MQNFYLKNISIGTFQVLQETVEKIETENRDLNDNLTRYKRMLMNQTTELQTLKKEHKKQHEELEEVRKTIKVLKSELDVANEERKGVASVIAKKDAEIAEIKQAMQDILDQLREKTRMFEGDFFYNFVLILDFKS